MTIGASSGIITRPAHPGDARWASRFYVDAYTPVDGSSARDHYPFVQLLEAASLRREIVRPDLCWVVAEMEGRVVGMVGATRSAPGSQHRVAEFFGLVVDEKMRGAGVATAMIRYACGMLDETTDVMFAETRTATAGAWRAFRKCGFLPFGFEPYAHNTPAGSEPMLFLGRLSERAKRAPHPPVASTRGVERLASAVLGAAGLAATRVADDGAHGHAAASGALREPRVGIARGGEALRALPGNPSLVLVESRARARRLQRLWADASRHRAGVVGLERYEGVDRRSDRFSTSWVVARHRGREVGCARVAFDRADQRARILRVESATARFEGEILDRVVGVLSERAGSGPLTAVVDVRVDDAALQGKLETLGFVPTVYYPRLLVTATGRLDAVQYTRTWGRDFSPALAWVRDLAWSDAARVIHAVASVAATAEPASPGTARPTCPHASSSFGYAGLPPSAASAL
jgi:RimJ/RimL family protein N-acetyltransferase